MTETERADAAECANAALKQVLEDVLRSKGALPANVLDALFRGLGAPTGVVEQIDVRFDRGQGRGASATVTFVDFDLFDHGLLARRVALVPLPPCATCFHRWATQPP